MNGKPDVGNGGIASDTSDSAAIESSPISSSSSSSPNYKQESDDHDNIRDIDIGANQQHPKGQDDKKENLQRVVRFLQHPAVLGMSKSTKDAYLHSKGVSDELIQTAREHDEKEEQEQNTLMSSTGPDGRKNISDGNNNNDDDDNVVDIEIVSYSRPSSTSLIGKLVFPFIDKMQDEFFRNELDALEDIARKANKGSTKPMI
mmetsp:Transcript_2555/g.2872  ORF Transcript_2555/g.2872 Transcript_2555/m.2872 type:complete len:202 (-) Transcript_2555:21-626(-)